MYVRIHYILLSSVVLLLLLTACQEKRQDRFQREAQDYTATHCPQQLDEHTVLDSMVFEPNGEAGELKMYYSLLLTPGQRDTLMRKLYTLGQENLRVVRNSVQFVRHKEAGVSFTYIYHDAEQGDEIITYHYEKEDCE